LVGIGVHEEDEIHVRAENLVHDLEVIATYTCDKVVPVYADG
jgi:hypothetical protein